MRFASTRKMRIAGRPAAAAVAMGLVRGPADVWILVGAEGPGPGTPAERLGGGGGHVVVWFGH